MKKILFIGFYAVMVTIFFAPNICFCGNQYFIEIEPAQEKEQEHDVEKEKKRVEEKKHVDVNQNIYEDPNTYKIGCGDVLEIITWKEPDFSNDNVSVRIDGKITFLLLGDIQAAGLTPMELTSEITTKLEKFVSGAVVTIFVKSPISKQFYILGEIARTGSYPLAKDLTALQAFALAGGFTEWASKKEIIVLRHENGQDEIIRINYKNIINGVNLEQNIFIKAEDIIIIP